MATLTPANRSVDWPDTYLASKLHTDNTNTAQALLEEVMSGMFTRVRLYSKYSYSEYSISTVIVCHPLQTMTASTH